MADEGKSRQIRAAAKSSQRKGAEVPRRSRWPLVVAIVLSLAVGAVILERLSRPAEETADTPYPKNSSAPAGAETGPQGSPRQSAGLSSPSPSPATGPAEAISPPSTVEETFAEAQRVADRLVEAFPDDPQALTFAGRIQYTLGNSAKATGWWEKCLQLQPQAAEAKCALGMAAWNRGDFQKAVTLLREGTTANARLLGENIFYLADALMNLGKASEAATLLEDASRSGRLSPAGYYVLGQACLQSKEYEKARKQFEAALSADPRFANAHYGLSMALARLGETEKAAKHREEYAKFKKNDVAARDRADGAGLSAEKADPVETRRLVATYCLGAAKIYGMHGRVDEAERLLRMAATLDPQNPEPQKILEMVHRDQRRKENATRIGGEDTRQSTPTNK